MKARNLLFSISMSLAAVGVTVAVPTSSAMAASATDKQVTSVRAEVARINKGLSKLKKTNIMVENVSAEGTNATYYRNGKTIRKIEAEVLGESFQAKIDLYYSGGQLIFALDRHSTYKDGLGSPIDQTTVFRMYYSNGKSIRVLAGTTRLTADEAETEVGVIDEISQELKAAIA